MAQFPVVRGLRARFTKINSCGRPVPGAANRLVTSGFVSVHLTPVMKDADELEQTNAEGKVCVTDRTPPVRKYYTVEVDLCNVDSELISMLNSWQQVLDYDDASIGFRDQADVESDYGVAIELWTGGKGEDDCPVPSTDSIFSTGGSGKKYGYLLVGATEFQLGDFTVEAAIATFKLSGISLNMSQWGRGPYNVAGTDADGTAGRLLSPVGTQEHFTLFRTPVAPPEETGGAVPLDILGKFTGSTYYYGGPSNAPAADVAPDQDSSAGYVVSITGAPTAGTFTLKAGDLETADIDYSATAADVKTALAALDDGYAAADWTTSGGALPGTAVTIIPPVNVVIEVGANALTGGTTPTVAVDPA